MKNEADLSRSQISRPERRLRLKINEHMKEIAGVFAKEALEEIDTN